MKLIMVPAPQPVALGQSGDSKNVEAPEGIPIF